MKCLVIVIALFVFIAPSAVMASDFADHLEEFGTSIENAIELNEMLLEIEGVLYQVLEMMESQVSVWSDSNTSPHSDAPPSPPSDSTASMYKGRAPQPATPPTNIDKDMGGSTDREQFAVSGIPFALRLAPAAVFPHGNLDHPAQVYRPFWIGETEVTYELWYEIQMWAEGQGYRFSPGREGSSSRTPGEAPTSRRQEPAVYMAWADALAWCNALSENIGLQPVYRYSGGVLRDSGHFYETGETAIAAETDGFRLPTEEEWHLAARFNGSAVVPGGIELGGHQWLPRNWASGATDAITNPDAVFRVAWVQENSRSTQPVAGLSPNALGLYDMTGNASEWVFKQYGHIASSRGGSYYHDLRMVGVGDISHNYQYYNRYAWVGLRLARSARAN